MDVEGLGIVYLEAGATGKAVVAGDSGGAPDAVLDGRTGVEDLRRPVHQAAKTAGDRGELPGAVFGEGGGLRQRHPVR